MPRCVIDIEANGLLLPSLDYKKRPYKLKESYRLWCIVVRDVDTDEIFSLTLDACTKDNLKKILANYDEIIGHNIIEFDLCILKLLDLMDYSIGYPGKPSKLYGKDVKITDTLLWSRLLNPDRYDEHGRHNLEAWGKRLGEPKQEFHEFDVFSERMVEYCIQDTKTNAKVYNHLMSEKAKGTWDRAYSMESKLADLVLRQSVFGFKFDTKLAAACVAELDTEMEQIRNKINPLLPPKKPNKGEQKFYEWPKNPFLKNGDLAKVMYRFAEKIGAKIHEDIMQEPTLEFEGKLYKIADRQPLDVHIASDIDDLDNLKSYLKKLGWIPTEWKERDLLKKQDKTKKTKEEIEATIDRYVNQTFDGYFAEDRCEILDVPCDPVSLKNHLMKLANKGKQVWVPTGPKIAIGLEKKICRGLEQLGEKAEFVKDLVKYLTYKHRRNSILGGDIEYDPDIDDIEEIDSSKGFLSFVRDDGRIPTPANTLGANTGRFRHNIVCNIPRVSSLYGDKMRALFGCGDNYWQCGFDFASLEARIQSHYCLPYKDGAQLSKTLLAVKPGDVHSILAGKLGIDRALAKSIFYAVVFGAQPKKIAKMVGCSLTRAQEIYDDFWKAVPALKELKEKIEEAWVKTGKIGIKGLDGRLLVSRSKHSLVNIAFQSGGALFVKWSIVRISELMEQAGILGDPFVDDDKAIKLFQMIVNHDEVQYACHPKLLNVKIFKDEEEANKNIEPYCSAIGHGTKGPYIAYQTLPITCINTGIKIAEDELKMKISMAQEWITGLNWAQCH